MCLWGGGEVQVVRSKRTSRREAIALGEEILDPANIGERPRGEEDVTHFLASDYLMNTHPVFLECIRVERSQNKIQKTFFII